MKRPTNEYDSGATNQEWLPSQNWQEIAKKRQEKIAVAEAERAYKSHILKRRIMLGLFVAGTIAIIAPTAIYPRFAQADDLDAAMGYTLAQKARVTFGGRLDNAEPIVSNGQEFLDEPAEGTDGTEQAQPQPEQQPADPVAQEPIVFEDTDPVTPAEVTYTGQSPDPEPASQGYLPIESYAQESSQQPTETYVEMPAPSPVEQVSVQAESVSPAEQQSDAAHAGMSASGEPSWWSIPSWSTASAPQYDALGIWDVHYYIAHNWTSYGEVILGLRNGDTLYIDGQHLKVVDSEYFYAGTDYETVRARFGWDTWCLQTCYGDTQVRIVSMKPIG